MSDAAFPPDDDPRLDAPIPRDQFGGRCAHGVVELLEELLVGARSGHVRGVAVCAITRGHVSATAYAVGDAHVSALVAGTERVKLRLLHHGGPARDGSSNG